MEIDNIVRKVLLRYPIFGSIIVNLEFKFTKENVNAPAYTDGKAIYYTSQFIDEYTDDEKEFIIAHEIFHIVLSHLFRNIEKDSDLLNYVEDGVINQLLINDGLKMPEGVVYIENALLYSVDELYVLYLPKLKEIKQWMKANTYHMDLNEILEILQKMIENSYSKDIKVLEYENEKLKEELLEDYKRELENIRQKAIGILGLGETIAGEKVGTAPSLLSWQDVLEASIYIPDDSSSYFEIQMDGIIKKEERITDGELDSEIIIDSSGSMDMTVIKIILRECKNILSFGHLKVGFCDMSFYGWNDIKTDYDIDNLSIKGRGGTDFQEMANSFSSDSINKIVITDGLGYFPMNRPDILWIIFGSSLPYIFLSSNVRYIFINTSKINIYDNVQKILR